MANPIREVAVTDVMPDKEAGGVFESADCSWAIAPPTALILRRDAA